MKCPHCGRELDPGPSDDYCYYCGGRLSEPDDSGKVTSTEDQNSRKYPDAWSRQRSSRLSKEHCPWEDQESLGFFQSVYQTVSQSMLNSADFFSKLPRTDGFLQPLLYGLIIGTLGEMVSALWLFTLESSLLEEAPALAGSPAIIGILIPILVFMKIVGSGLVLHAALFSVGAAKEQLEATFRVYCYSSGPDLLNIVPILGPFAGLVWKLYILIVGLREVHGATTSRAAAAVCIGVALFFCLLVMAVVAIVGSVGLSAD